MRPIEKRTDCDDFEAKPYPHSCGDCQTDGHYLCAGCKHIADYDTMELQDNRLHYYPKQEMQRMAEWEANWQKQQDEIHKELNLPIK